MNDALTTQTLGDVLAALPKVPKFYIAHWLRGAHVLTCEREGRVEHRLPPQVWAALRTMAVGGTAPHADRIPDALQDEEHPPADILDQCLGNPAFAKLVRWPTIDEGRA